VNPMEHLRRQFTYDEWANRVTLAAIQSGHPDERSLELMAHIVAAEQVWLERLLRKPQSSPVWPKADLSSCEQRIAEMGGLWRDYLAGLSADSVSNSISYKNSKGEEWTSTIADVLTHVLMHSAYHRGQIASHMRETGQTPAYTDFIHGVRQGWVK
jgi:uncharacterized damage-inducible protein DinB